MNWVARSNERARANWNSIERVSELCGASTCLNDVSQLVSYSSCLALSGLVPGNDRKVRATEACGAESANIWAMLRNNWPARLCHMLIAIIFFILQQGVQVDDPLQRPISQLPRPGRRPRLVYDPPLCPQCSEVKLEEKKRQMFEFEEEKIYIRKLGDRDVDLKLEDDDDAYKVCLL